MKKLRLYIWREVFAGWYGGIAGAMATSADGAREQVTLDRIRDCGRDGHGNTVRLPLHRRQEIRAETFKELSDKPEVYTNPRGFHMHGGD